MALAIDAVCLSHHILSRFSGPCTHLPEFGKALLLFSAQAVGQHSPDRVTSDNFFFCTAPHRHASNIPENSGVERHENAKEIAHETSTWTNNCSDGDLDFGDVGHSWYCVRREPSRNNKFYDTSCGSLTRQRNPQWRLVTRTEPVGRHE